MKQQLAKLDFVLKKLGGDPAHDYVYNHEILDIAQRMGLNLGFTFRWDEKAANAGPRSMALGHSIGQIAFQGENSLSDDEATQLRLTCRSVRLRIWEHCPKHTRKEDWLRVLCHMAWERPLPPRLAPLIFQRRRALDTIYGSSRSRYDAILASVV